jgi:phenylacetate-CoA ligase
VRLTNVSQLWWFACYLRDLEWAGLDPRGTLAAVRYFKTSGEAGRQALEGVRLPCWNDVLAQLVENGPSFGMDVHQEPRRQLAWLRRVDPDYLLSFPSNLEFLAGLVAESGGRLPRLRAIQAIAETLTDDARERIEAAFGVPVRNTYSCAEAGYLASPCPAGHGLHVHAENVYLEVLDDAGDPVPPGGTGRVVLTTLHNFLTPFVRYEVMDRATVAPGPCPCGRGLPLLSGVLGKSHPVLQLPDGTWQNSSRLAVGMRKIGGFYQFRIVQSATDHYVVRVVPNPDWSTGHAKRVTALVHDFCRRPVRVDVATADRIDLRPGGKGVDIVTDHLPG